MKNLFIQKEPGWCTAISLANLFRDDFFMKFLTDENYKGACIDKENEMISQSENHSHLRMVEIVFVRHSYNKSLPVDYVYELLKTDDAEGMELPFNEYCVPFIMTVRISPLYLHSVCAWNYKGKLLYSDPYKEDIVLINSVEDLRNQFTDVYGVERPFDINTNLFIVMNVESDRFNFLRLKKY